MEEEEEEIMTYELAKQLKDAEFPQDLGEARCPCHEPWGMCGVHEEPPAYIPTLSELIEACGDRFVGLDRQDGGWKAIGYIDELKLTYQEGKTPEEAVVSLWLALNKKK